MSKIRKLICLLLAIVILGAGSAALAAGDLDDAGMVRSGVVDSQGADTETQYSRSAYILQGNTVSASDCHAMYNGLRTRYSMNTAGWTWNGEYSFSELYQRAGANHFLPAGQYTLAYYSGHGSRVDGVPKLNVHASSTYGSYTPFDVSAVLNVDSDDDWRTACSWVDSNINVLILASCYQLDSSIVKYYGRAMRASNIRAIAGYNESAPTHETDANIANAFINLANGQNSVLYSWQHANWNSTNGYQPWAVLVYMENGNQYYRLPGFPGGTYSPPSPTAAVFRYADFLSGPYVVGLNRAPIIPENTPAEIAINFSDTCNSEFVMQREMVENEDQKQNLTLLDSAKDVADEYLSDTLSAYDLSHSICMTESVIREEVDPDVGVLADTAQTVERVFTYYNTYNGIKILNDFIKVGVDCEGINTVYDNWKEIFVNEVNASEQITNTPIQACDALKIAISSAGAGAKTKVLSQMLAYYPVSNNVYRLCYEFIIDGDVYYVDTVNGAVLNAS